MLQLVLSSLFLAISISYAPSSTNQYAFKQVPNDEYVTFIRDSEGWNDILNSSVVFDWRIRFGLQKCRFIGAIRRCPINGTPFSSRTLRHEDLAWIQEAIEERDVVPTTNGGGLGSQWGIRFYFHKKEPLLSPDFEFTNKYCVALPSGDGSPWVIDYDDWHRYGVDDVRNHFGGDSSKIGYISYIPSENVKDFHTVKREDYEKVAEALQSFSYGNVYAYGDYNSASNNIINTSTENKGTYIGGDWEDHKFTPEVKTRKYRQHSSTNTYTSFYASYSYYDHRIRYFYASGWNKKAERFTSCTEAEETGYHDEYETGISQGGSAYVVFNASTNTVMPDGFNRIREYQAFHLFRLGETVRDDSSEPLVDEDKIVIIPDDGSGTVLWGDEAKAATSYHSGGVNGKYIIYVFGKNPSELYEDAFSACGLTWKQKITADRPKTLTFDDFTESQKTFYGHIESKTNKSRSQTIQYYGCYIFHSVNFRMK